MPWDTPSRRVTPSAMKSRASRVWVTFLLASREGIGSACKGLHNPPRCQEGHSQNGSGSRAGGSGATLHAAGAQHVAAPLAQAVVELFRGGRQAGQPVGVPGGDAV